MYNYAFLNGEIVDARKSHLSLNDLGLLRGYAVFDFCRTYQGEPFLLGQYLDRLCYSSQALRLPVNYKKKKLKDIVHNLLDKNAVHEAAIRFLVSGGPTPDGISIGTPTFAILIEDVPRYPDEYYTQGIRLVSYPYQRLYPQIKTTYYLPAVKLKLWREEHEAQDILYCHQGQVLETTRSNVFLFKEDQLITPSEGVLPGITRQHVLSLAEDRYSIEERPVRYEEINEADELFITGTSKKVMPVVEVDGLSIDNGQIGTRTQQLMKDFEESTETPIIESSI